MRTGSHAAQLWRSCDNLWLIMVRLQQFRIPVELRTGFIDLSITIVLILYHIPVAGIAMVNT